MSRLDGRSSVPQQETCVRFQCGNSHTHDSHVRTRATTIISFVQQSKTAGYDTFHLHKCATNVKRPLFPPGVFLMVDTEWWQQSGGFWLSDSSTNGRVGGSGSDHRVWVVQRWFRSESDSFWTWAKSWSHSNEVQSQWRSAAGGWVSAPSASLPSTHHLFFTDYFNPLWFSFYFPHNLQAHPTTFTPFRFSDKISTSKFLLEPLCPLFPPPH